MITASAAATLTVTAALYAANPVPEPFYSLAVCESGMGGEPRWHYRGSHEGGLQWNPASWRRWRDTDDPLRAYDATAAEEVAAARRYVAYEQDQGRGGWGPWPSCAEQLGLPR